MQLAIVNGERVEAVAGSQGKCPECDAVMIAKCGPRTIHHWAHKGRRNCDPWWENETDWHRAWKNLFPVACREVSHTAWDGEIHRADIRTPTGIYIEVQHSSMTDSERISREAFYRNLVWVIDGRGFRDNFDIYHMLHAPTSRVAQDLVWAKATRAMQGAARGAFFRLSANQEYQPNATKATLRGGLIESIDAIRRDVEASYSGHHQYDWIRPRRTWLDATCPVYIDFGGDVLVKLDVYDESGLHCVRLMAKWDFVHDVMTKTSADAIGCHYHLVITAARTNNETNLSLLPFRPI